MTARLTTCLLLLCLFGCQVYDPTLVGGVCSSPLIYGTDDRIEAFQVPDDDLWTIAHSSAVALINARKLVADESSVRVEAPTLRDDLGLCEFERFSDQRRGAFCSGVLIDYDLVLTAGHCIKSEFQCRTTRIAFDYLLEGDNGNEPRMTPNSIYSCDSIVVRKLDPETRVDYAIIRLDRPALNREPVFLSPDTRSIREDEPVTVFGYGMGIPLKVDLGGTITDVRDLDSGFARVNSDTFIGNSGSPVFDRFRRVVGTLVRGQSDFEEGCGCMVVRQTNRGGELIMTSNIPLAALCETGWPTRLCGSDAVCGDGQCTGREEASECPEDCRIPSCGDDLCQGSEIASCPEDCEVEPPEDLETIPSDWVCPEGFYATRDGCDCGCGAYDPDCDVPTEEILNCAPGQTCGPAGDCIGTSTLPDGWTCEPDYFDAGDDCDCDCGAYDPDCDDAGLRTLNCDDDEVCDSRGECIPSGEPPTTTGPPSTWDCAEGFWDAGDGCDCNCGPLDPDCEDSTQRVYGCASGMCNPDGSCVESGSTPDP